MARRKRFRLVTLLGIRPDIIRLAKLIRLLDEGQKENQYQHILAHTGQHYDYNLDRVFYGELGVRKPEHNLNVGRTLRDRGKKANYISQLGLLFERTGRFLEKVQPDALLYLGDTNSVLSSIIAARSQVPIIHVEGGGRSFDWRMPEEKNRIIIDHLSDLIYCYLPRYQKLLLREGVSKERIRVVGNIIVDPVKASLPKALSTDVLDRYDLEAGTYCLVTLHREENVEDDSIFKSKVLDIARLARKMPLIWPVMPRVKKKLTRSKFLGPLKKAGVILTEPLGFFEILHLEASANVIVTDSGTIQEEACLLGVPCLVTRRSTERPETIRVGATLLRDTDLYKNALKASKMKRTWNRNVLNPQGGSPSERIYKDLARRIKSGWLGQSRELKAIRNDVEVRRAYGLHV